MKGKRLAPAEIASSDLPTRGRIVAAARGHFLAHGFRSVTMDDLAAELGMSKKTFYTHFESKVALVEAVMMEKLGGAEVELDRITSNSDLAFTDALQALLACLQKQTGEIQPAFLRDLRRDAPEVFTAVESRRAAMIQRCFSRLLTAGRKAGMIREDVPSKMMIEILLGATRAIMNPTKLEELGLTPKAGYSAILEVFLRGVMTKNGRDKL